MKHYFNIALLGIFLTQFAISQDSQVNKGFYFPAGYGLDTRSVELAESGAILWGQYLNLKNNSYWVKSGTLESGNGEVIVSFERELTVNNIKAIDQVKAHYGYIVEVVRDKDESPLLYVWIANEKGERDSDDIIIEINK